MRDLQPWIDYQDMLNQYVRCGYLEMSPSKNEAYITEAAFFTLFGVFADRDYTNNIAAAVRAWRKARLVVHVIRMYALILDTHSDAYNAYIEASRKLRDSRMPIPETAVGQTRDSIRRFGEGANMDFALHIVDDVSPHDLHLTLFITTKRRWWCPWQKDEHIEVIPYI